MSSFLNEIKKDAVENLISKIRFPDYKIEKRNALYKELLLQNENASENVLKNINSLKEKNCYTVITGQQLGLYGGPLYTIYKILNTVQLAKDLNEAFPDKKFVPLYWFEAEDADIAEVSKVYSFKDELGKYTYNYEDNKESVALKNFNEDIERLNELISYEGSAYKSGKNWLEATKLFFADLFNEYGIIGFSSNSGSARTLAKDFWKITIENHGQIKKAIQDRSNELERSGFNNQFELRNEDSFIFHHTDNGRVKLNEINKFNEETKYSTNVILRPLLQDFIFPNTVYVGGDAEIAYQQQIATAYSFYSREAPVLYPRSHATVLDAKSQRLFKKYNITRIDDLKRVKEAELETAEREKLTVLFEDFNKHFNLLYHELEKLNFADLNTSQKILEGSKARQEKGFEQLEQRIDSMLKKLNEDLLNHFSYLETILFPEDNLQERTYSIMQFGKNILNFAELFFEQIDQRNLEIQLLKL